MIHYEQSQQRPSEPQRHSHSHSSKSTGENNNSVDGWILLSCFSFTSVHGGSLSHCHVWTIRNVISLTCASPAGKNICFEKGSFKNQAVVTRAQFSFQSRVISACLTHHMLIKSRLHLKHFTTPETRTNNPNLLHAVCHTHSYVFYLTENSHSVSSTAERFVMPELDLICNHDNSMDLFSRRTFWPVIAGRSQA